MGMTMRSFSGFALLAGAIAFQFAAGAIAGASETSAPASVGNPHMCSEDMYPVAAMQAGIEGTTLLSFNINSQGDVSGVTVAKSSGNRDLDDVSIACVLQWHYRPATQNGAAVPAAWMAAVKWEARAPSSGPLENIYAAANSCLAATHPSPAELAMATRTTVIHVRFVDGEISSVGLEASSGSSELDERVVDCYQQVDRNLTVSIVGDQRVLIPVNWKLVASRS
jgi:TonB family protein